MAKKVLMYGTSVCTWCARAREFFKKYRIKYKEIDVENNEKALQEMSEKSRQLGTPVIDVDGNIVVGFDEAKLKEFLKIKDQNGKEK